MNKSDFYEDDLLSCSMRNHNTKQNFNTTERRGHVSKPNKLRVHRPEIIMNTVEAWSKDFSGRLLRNLKHGDIRRSRSEARPLVFGGTYPIDEPIHRKCHQQSSRKMEYSTLFQPESYPIDKPITNFANWNGDNVKRRLVQSHEPDRNEEQSDSDLTDSEDNYHVKDE